MTKSILLIGNTTSYSSLRLAEEARGLGMTFDLVHPSKVEIDSDNIKVNSKELTRDFFDYDIYIFRGIRSNEQKMQTVAAQLAGKGKRVLENILTKQLLPEDKFVPPSQEDLYRVPEYEVVEVLGLDRFNIKEFPVVAKKLNSSIGKGVAKIESKTELLEFAKGSKGSLIIQKYYPLEFDLRVFVVGDEVIASFARYNNKDNFITTQRGGFKEAMPISDSMKKAALEATRLQGLEIAGVDMFLHQNTPYILEVNSSPQFKICEKLTGVNVAEKILEYLVK